LGWSDIDCVLLVGGSTRMPMVSRMLKEISGKNPDGSVAVDEAVAHGAALQAGVLINKAQGQPSAIKIRNVNSHSLGVVATDNLTGRKRTAILVPRNTRLPVTAKRVFRTHKENQRSILVQIVEGESANPNDCTRIGSCVVRDLPPHLPEKTSINVLFHYEANGRLTVKVTVEGTDKQLQHAISRENSLTQEQLDAWRDFACGLE
jgi:molecular chaperone DnaK